jgi:hypothetical protein
MIIKTLGKPSKGVFKLFDTFPFTSIGEKKFANLVPVKKIILYV